MYIYYIVTYNSCSYHKYQFKVHYVIVIVSFDFLIRLYYQFTFRAVISTNLTYHILSSKKTGDNNQIIDYYSNIS